MIKAPNILPSDPIELRSAAEGLVTLAKSQALEIEKLKHQLKGHQRHRFGSKSESADQLNLELQLEEEETAAARAAQPEVDSDPETKQKPKRKPLPASLPREEQILCPGEACSCGGGLRTLGEDVTEELEYIPGRCAVHRIVVSAWPAIAVIRSSKPLCQHDRLNVVAPGPDCSRMCLSQNTRITAP